jgi:kinesin family protein 2/24
MFDKRESRRMNAKPFAAAVQRWRNRRIADGGYRNNKNVKPRRARAGGVSVYVRKRPLFAHEQRRGEFDVVTVPDPPAPLAPSDATEVVIHNCQMHADLKRMFTKHASFDVTRAFGEAVESEEVYDTTAAPMVAGALRGGVGALFMYGQTGSGKTHTMESIEQSAIEALFSGLSSDYLPHGLYGIGGADAGVEGDEGWVSGAVSIRVAYFEIAGKKCTDLLSPQRTDIALKEMGGGLVGAGAGRALEPHEYRQLDVQLLGAVEPVATSADELAAIIAAGKSRRATSATHCNAASSRSHAVLRLTCQLAGGDSLTTGRLTLVDCAGSERKEDNMHHSAEQRKETAEINASLYALKECVRMRRLQHQRFGFNGDGGGGGGGGGGGDGARHVHVPYRSSHLTRVLMECFVRPDAQLGVIGTVSPASVDTEHSVSTLKTVGLIGGGEVGSGRATPNLTI